MNKPSQLTPLKVVALATVYCIVLTLLFQIAYLGDLFSVMSITFLFCMPTIAGILITYLSDLDRLQSKAYVICLPWVSILLFFFVTLALELEGWACWVMALPLFMITSSLGGIIGGRMKLRKMKKKANLHISVLVMLPFLLGPIESMISAIPGTYKAYTYIDIKADDNRIWSNVTRVGEIPEEQDKGWLTNSLNFPRPVKAVLDFEGVGAKREAIFTNGLVFHETVLAYQHKKKMVFSIKANPYEIPSTTLDEHVVIGGDYFDVLNGTYELEKLDEKTYRLHLYSHFKLNTTFNFYASWWARWIMQDIQNNILQVIKTRAEQG
jgi:hypothetical protein